MEDYELIGRQACEIYKLKQKIEEYKKAMSDVFSMAYCIGGPLNDNILEFNHEQKVFLSKLVGHIDFRGDDDE